MRERENCGCGGGEGDYCRRVRDPRMLLLGDCSELCLVVALGCSGGNEVPICSGGMGCVRWSDLRWGWWFECDGGDGGWVLGWWWWRERRERWEVGTTATAAACCSTAAPWWRRRVMIDAEKRLEKKGEGKVRWEKRGEDLIQQGYFSLFTRFCPKFLRIWTEGVIWLDFDS